jgi:hypothetical protein
MKIANFSIMKSKMFHCLNQMKELNDAEMEKVIS